MGVGSTVGSNAQRSASRHEDARKDREAKEMRVNLLSQLRWSEVGLLKHYSCLVEATVLAKGII